MKASAIVFSMAVLCLVAAQQSPACERIDIEGEWNLIANGTSLRFEITDDSNDNFWGVIRGSNEPNSRAYDGTCDDTTRKITFVRRSQPVGKFEQVYEGYFWKKNGVTGVAGFFISSGKKRGFYMTKRN